MDTPNGTPQGDNNRPSQVQVNTDQRINPQLNFSQQQQPQSQIPPVYYMPVQGPNGIMYMPVSGQLGGMPMNMPVQGQVVNNVPQMQNVAQGQVFYGFPMVNAQRQVENDCDCFTRLGNYFRTMTIADKYRFWLNVLSVFVFIAMIVSFKFACKRWHRKAGIFGLIISSFVFLTLRTGVRALKAKNTRGFKRFLRMAGAIFVINVYNFMMFLIFAGGHGGRRGCPGGFIGMLAVVIISGLLVCKGRKLFRNHLKPEWRQNRQRVEQDVAIELNNQN